MNKNNFKVSISPTKACELIKFNEDADLVYEEFNDLGDEKSICTLIFEKYYMRAGNRAALVVIIDNIKGYTDIRSIATGSSSGMFFNIDWGAADDFSYSVMEILQKYIIK